MTDKEYTVFAQRANTSEEYEVGHYAPRHVAEAVEAAMHRAAEIATGKGGSIVVTIRERPSR